MHTDLDLGARNGATVHENIHWTRKEAILAGVPDFTLDESMDLNESLWVCGINHT
jgi:hypothetical protein